MQYCLLHQQKVHLPNIRRQQAAFLYHEALFWFLWLLSHYEGGDYTISIFPLRFAVVACLRKVHTILLIHIFAIIHRPKEGDLSHESEKAASAALVAAMTMSAAAPTVMAAEASMPITAEDSTATVPDDVRDDTLGDTNSAVEDRAQGSAIYKNVKPYWFLYFAGVIPKYFLNAFWK